MDKLKEFTAKFREDENNDDSPEILGGIPDPDINIGEMYGPAPEYDEIDKPTPCVYGPAPEYDDDLDTCVPDEDDIIEKKNAQE